jgi:hypothetical protein
MWFQSAPPGHIRQGRQLRRLPQRFGSVSKHLYLGRKNSHLVILVAKKGAQGCELLLLQSELVVESL